MSAFILFLFLAESFTIDELHIKRIGSSVSHGPVVLFNGMSGLNIKVYWYHLQKEKGKIIDPNKIQIYVPRVLTTEEGFLLAQLVGQPKLVHLDLNGNYLKSQYLHDFQNWDENLVLKALGGYGKPIIANFETRDSAKIVIATIDTEEQSIEYMHEYHKSEFTHRFFPWENGFVHLISETGQMEKLSRDFKFERAIRPAREPIRIDPSRPIARRRKFFSLLWPTAFLENRIIFSFNKFDPASTVKYPEPITRALFLEKNEYIESKSLLLGEHQGKQLRYDPVEQEFTLVRQ
jgi:hypothetical protein